MDKDGEAFWRTLRVEQVNPFARMNAIGNVQFARVGVAESSGALGPNIRIADAIGDTGRIQKRVLPINARHVMGAFVGVNGSEVHSTTIGNAAPAVDKSTLRSAYYSSINISNLKQIIKPYRL